MEYQLIEVLDNDENGIVELVENEKGQRYVRRTMQGKVEVYLALKQLSHKFLPEIISAEFDGKQTVTIEEYVNSKGDLSCLKDEGELVNAFGELCEVLEFIHAREIIHRDIKPSNVLVADDGHIRLIDFDAARRYKEDSSTDTRFLGTKGYAAPEQFGFAQTDYTADIYALGVTMKNVMGEFSDTRKYKEIIRKCTEFDPKNRYKSAAAVKNSLMIGKKRYFLETAVAAIICVGIVLGVIIIGNIRSNSESQQAMAYVSESESETVHTTTTEIFSEETSVETTTIPTTTSVTPATTVTETTAVTTTPTATTVPITEAKAYTEISFSVAEAYDISEEGFELISPRNEKLVPKVAQEEIEDGFYSDYFVDDYRFVDDRNIHGRWESVAIIDTFDPKLIKKYFLNGDEKHVKSPEIGHIQSIEFIDYGQCFSYYNTYASISKWTHGAITNDYFIYYTNISGYYIFRIDGIDYLFVEGKLNDGDLKDDGVASNCVVFKRFVKDEEKIYDATGVVTINTTKAAEKSVSSASEAEITREIISPTDESKIAKFEKKLAADGKYYDFYDNEYKFVSDPNVIGKWTAVDYVYDIENWVYDSSKATDGLWVKSAEFSSDGKYMCYVEDNLQCLEWKWTYGQALIPYGGWDKCCICGYYLYNIDGEEFLFVEWKNGDYIDPKEYRTGWYVFKKYS